MPTIEGRCSRHWRKVRRGFSAILAINLVAACAYPTSLKSQNDLENSTKTPISARWSGRVSLQVHSEPVQSFSGSFELQGNAQAGSLLLSTPLGSAIAQLRWENGVAELVQGQETRHFASVQAMLEHTTGAAIPMEALLAWLRGEAIVVPGWQADLSNHARGRISALRSAPAPQAQLRIVMDP